MAVKELVVGNLNVVFVGEKRKYDLLDFWNEIISHIFVNDISMGRTPKLLLGTSKNPLKKEVKKC